MPAARNPLRALAEKHHAFVASDNVFQRRARLVQSLWRERHGLPIGEHRGRPLGSRLAMPRAKDELLNYLTDTIRDVVKREVLDPDRRGDKLYGEPRIFNDLLSSQPLCFNLFGELQRDLPLASRVFRRLTDGRAHEVTAIDFEHSPGRGDARYTGDRSAFDVFLTTTSPSGEPGFIGIEVKYHEDLSDQPAPHRARYDAIADAMGAFRPDARELDRLKQKPLQQIWRDHLLAGSLLLAAEPVQKTDLAQAPELPPYRHGAFVFLYPEGNVRCAKAVAAYQSCLTDPDPAASTATFAAWTLEKVLTAIQAAPWADAVHDRYLSFDALAA